ncbi:BolA family protein [Parvibium lacunae]|uniref:BolA family transcriptional regulator n=1 Tax=Parvibium lacunae TaxID=1888893 RepID=A0A368L808_9BURK|nr:BolA family protein [Parvibium lacunae]RCS59641.1 BolA family transcriptional regulator [Parvibium lacunae]
MAIAIETLRERLQILAPQHLEIMDESHQHIGHAGAQGGGGHYRLIIASPHFVGLSPVQRHRLVYDALADLMRREIHALAIEARLPQSA